MPITFKSLVAADATREQIEDWCRGQAQVMPAGDLNLCRVLGKYLMYVLPRDYAQTPHLALSGIWQPWVTMAVARHVTPGMCCMDVGACYGYYALLMADLVGSTGHVEAWEPVHSELIEASAQLNGLPVLVRSCAMGPEEKDVRFLRDSPGTLGLFEAGANITWHADRPQDQLVLSTQGPPAAECYDFIHIDTYGTEASVWQALSGVREVSPHLTVCMQFHPFNHAHPKAFLQELVTAGFALAFVDGDGEPRACTPDDLITVEPHVLWLTRKRP